MNGGKGMSEQLDSIRQALKAGDKAEARRLLGPVLQDQPSAEAWYLAAQAADDYSQAAALLRKALALDPDHAQAKSQLESLNKGQRVAEEGVYEMLWNCKFCGAQKLLGKTHRFCPACGSPQDPDWRYFPSDAEKVAVKDHQYTGVDVVCASCGSLSASGAEHCGRCGAPLTEAARVRVLEARAKSADQTFEQEDLQARQDHETDVAMFRKPATAQVASGGKGGRRVLIVLALVALLICGGLYMVFFSTKEASAYVIGHHWQREVSILVLSAQSENSRCESVPSGAYGIDRRREQVDTRRVQEGETCTQRQVDRGDGTFRQERVCEPVYRSEPVYGDVCYYSINRWVAARAATEEGGLQDALIWPATNITRSGDCLGCEREGDRSERYVLRFRRDGGDEFECAVDYDLWASTPLEASFTIETGSVLGDVRCGSLKPRTS